MNEYEQIIAKKSTETGSILSLGLDPILEKIPLEGDTEKRISSFCNNIVEAAAQSVGAIKPNYAYFAQYGFEGLRALKNVIDFAKENNVIVIFDGKRGDIGKSSEAYATEVFDFWGADAVTVSPYMGSDSVTPFNREGKGVYVLVRTSNSGSEDLQQLETKGQRIFEKTAQKVVEWRTGAVVGATDIVQLEQLSSAMKDAPLLIPGVGRQGGSAQDVANVLRNAGDLGIHRINSSSGITYAYEKDNSDYIEAAIKAIQTLNSEINYS